MTNKLMCGTKRCDEYVCEKISNYNILPPSERYKAIRRLFLGIHTDKGGTGGLVAELNNYRDQLCDNNKCPKINCGPAQSNSGWSESDEITLENFRILKNTDQLLDTLSHLYVKKRRSIPEHGRSNPYGRVELLVSLKGLDYIKDIFESGDESEQVSINKEEKFIKAVNEIIEEKLANSGYMEPNRDNIGNYGNFWIILDCIDEINSRYGQLIKEQHATVSDKQRASTYEYEDEDEDWFGGGFKGYRNTKRINTKRRNTKRRNSKRRSSKRRSSKRRNSKRRSSKRRL